MDAKSGTDTGNAATDIAVGDGEVVHNLDRALASRHVAMISIGGIIGAGLFVGSSAAIATIGPAAIVSYVLAGILVLLSMRMLGELAIGNPEIHMYTDYPRKYLGHISGFVGGWLYWYFWMIVVAVEALAGAIILQQWLPFPVWAIGLALLACLTAVNLTSARFYGEFEFWFSSIKVAAIIAFIAITGAYVLGLTGQPSPGLTNLTAFGGFAPAGAVSVLAGVTTVIFALTGAEITTVAAAEFERAGPRGGRHDDHAHLARRRCSMSPRSFSSSARSIGKPSCRAPRPSSRRWRRWACRARN